ncbi:MAG: methyltransferase domain-containing protein [Patescibacteria group bacterium]|nr:methyltransferase domain-containing protein [Candidatus Micrarchaeota archaeon]MBU2578234.1 methyltransferase domain-containing protein [Patescibacteria group bacterium]
MPDSHCKDVIKYFSKKATKYDLVDRQLYWRLSDELLKKIVQEKIIKLFSLQKELNILDAGAGTGRWSLILYDFLKEKNIKLHFDLLDITQEMLNEANEKIKKLGITNIMKTYLKNIEDLSDYGDNFYDIAISFYNVLSFVGKPEVALSEVFKKLKMGGVYASIVANKYHSYFFSILTNRITELDKIKNQSRIRFTDEMPYIHCFMPQGIKKLYEQAGFKEVTIIGFPNFIYPNIEDTKIEGQNKQSKNILKNEEVFDKILEIEFQECFNEDIAGRGNTLLVIGKK